MSHPSPAPSTPHALPATQLTRQSIRHQPRRSQNPTRPLPHGPQSLGHHQKSFSPQSPPRPLHRLPQPVRPVLLAFHEEIHQPLRSLGSPLLGAAKGARYLILFLALK